MNPKYRLIKKRAFESLEKFEQRLNEECVGGWKAISISDTNGSITVLLEREVKK